MKTITLSNRQIIIGTLVLGLAILIAGNFLRGNFLSSSKAVDPLDPVTQETMKAYGQVLVAKADAAIESAEKAVASSPATGTAENSGSTDLPVANVPWAMGDAKSATPSIPLHSKVVSYQIVHVDAHPSAFPMEGEKISLPMLNGQAVTAVVEKSVLSGNGDYTWSGHIADHGNDYPVVMTYGEHSTFATITTPQGAYSLESVDGLGWLYKNPAMIELSESGKNDFLEVDSSH